MNKMEPYFAFLAIMAAAATATGITAKAMGALPVPGLVATTGAVVTSGAWVTSGAVTTGASLEAAVVVAVSEDKVSSESLTPSPADRSLIPSIRKYSEAWVRSKLALPPRIATVCF